MAQVNSARDADSGDARELNVAKRFKKEFVQVKHLLTPHFAQTVKSSTKERVFRVRATRI